MRIDWKQRIDNGDSPYKIAGEIQGALRTEHVVVLENTRIGTSIFTRGIWDKGKIVEGEYLVVWEERIL